MQSSTESGLYRRPPFEIVNPQGKSPVLLVCEHASRYIPEELAQLGLDDAAAAEHIAWDIGALDLARELSARLDATLLVANYSRLLMATWFLSIKLSSRRVARCLRWCRRFTCNGW